MSERKTRDDLLRELARRAGLTDGEVDAYLVGEPDRELDCVAVVTCMGRLNHLRQTLQLVLQRTPMHVVLVDWSCPDGCGDWARELGDGVHVVRVPDRRRFHKCAALNAGCQHALSELDPDWLCVLDADTMIGPDWWAWLATNLPRDAFAFMQGHEARRDLSGLLVMRAADFRRSGGYDERMVGWGAEDFDMRARLHFKLGLPFVTIPWQHAEPIAHDDWARTRFQDGDRMQTYKANYKLMSENVCEWTGSHLHQLDANRVRPVFGGMW